MKNQTPLLTIPSRSSLRFAPVLVIAALMAVCPMLMRANTITTFNISGTCSPVAPFTGTTFGGTLTIDVTAGTITGINVTFPGFLPFNTVNSSFASDPSNWVVGSQHAGGSENVVLRFNTGQTPISLVGFTGGTITGNNVLVNALPTYFNINGSITAPTGSVPDAGSTLPLLGFASLGLVVLRRKLRC